MPPLGDRHAPTVLVNLELSEVADDDTFWNGTPEQMADKLRPYVDLGFRTVISEQPAPYDMETFERFIGEVKPLIEKG